MGGLPGRPRLLDRTGHPHLPGRQSAHQAHCVLGVAHRAIQRVHPDLILLSEAFAPEGDDGQAGRGRVLWRTTRTTWRNEPWEMRDYVNELAYGPTADYMRPNFWTNTPDILSGPLRHGPPAAFRMRFVLAATLVPSYGIYSGYELYENEPASDTNESTSTPRSTRSAGELGSARLAGAVHRHGQRHPAPAPGAAVAQERSLPWFQQRPVPGVDPGPPRRGRPGARRGQPRPAQRPGDRPRARPGRHRPSWQGPYTAIDELTGDVARGRGRTPTCGSTRGRARWPTCRAELRIH